MQESFLLQPVNWVLAATVHVPSSHDLDTDISTEFVGSQSFPVSVNQCLITDDWLCFVFLLSSGGS